MHRRADFAIQATYLNIYHHPSFHIYIHRTSDEKHMLSVTSMQEKSHGQGQDHKKAAGKGCQGDKLIGLEKSEVGGVS